VERDMPPRDRVDPRFDGHLDRQWADLTPDQKLDWIWEIMELRRLARRAKRAEGAGAWATSPGDLQVDLLDKDGLLGLLDSEKVQGGR